MSNKTRGSKRPSSKSMALAVAGVVTLLAACEATPLAADGLPALWRADWPATDFSLSAVPFDEIRSGGPARDGIPPIDEPHSRPLAEVQNDLPIDEPAITVELGGEARAYPLRVLLWHEIVNDSVGGQPIAVTFCPLCNAGIVFDRRVDGAVTSFGTTGMLRNSDLIMYDRTSESWWQQIDGHAIVGARTGSVLRALPSRLESLGEFARRSPAGQVLVPSDPLLRDYGQNPYVGYDGAPTPFLYAGEYAGPGSPMMRVVSVEGRNEAWSLELIHQAGRLASGDLELTWRKGQRSALDAERIAEGRDVGTIHVERIAADGRREPVVYAVPFAFAFRAFEPDSPIHHVN